MTVIEDLYPSRIADEPTVRERVDPVLHAGPEAAGPATPDELRRYDRDGFLFYPALFGPDEVAGLFDELERLRAESARESSPLVFLEPSSGEIRSVFAVHTLSEAFRNLARDPRVLDRAVQILGSPVYIHQSRVNLKPGFEGKEFYWHSDFETWHVEDGMPRMRALSCSITLTENNEFNGPLMVIPGSHRHYISCVGQTPENHYQESLRRQRYGVPDRDSLTRLVRDRGIVAPKGPAGSVLFFDCNIMHGSAGNISPYPRSNVFFVFNSVENTPVEPFGGQAPRPDFVASRDFTPLEPAPQSGGATR